LEPLIDIDKALNAEELRGRFLKHTRRAYRLIPSLTQPRILDIGCGKGQQTIELARLSGGEVIGIDIDLTVLTCLRQRIKQAGFGDRVRCLHVSLFDLQFDNNSFDVLWEEGVLHLLDLSRSLEKCRRLLKPEGYLVMHETTLWYESIQKKLTEFGFKLSNRHVLPKHYWWTEYGAPLERRIRAYCEMHSDASDSQEIAEYKNVVASIKGDPDKMDCGIYLLKVVNCDTGK
jgi:ubiquinone/menaquinone biosynthesis C-methylase UbiE